MGQTWITLRLYGTGGSSEEQALADTAATFTKVPRAMALGLDIRPDYEVQVQLADGRSITRPLASRSNHVFYSLGPTPAIEF